MSDQRIDELLEHAALILNKDSVDCPYEKDKMNLFIFGQPHHNLLKIVFEALSITAKDAFDGVLVNGCTCSILRGDSERMYQLDGQKKKEVDLHYVGNLLSQFDSTSKVLKFEYTTDQELTKSVNIHIVISADDYADVDWNYVQKNADYVLFSLTATVLLSMCERKILRTILLPNMGNEAGVLLTNNNMILSDDRPSIDSSLEKMFGNYSSPIFCFPDEDEQRFAAFINSLPDNYGNLAEKKHKRARKMELNELLSEIKLQIEILSSDNAKLDDAIELLNEKLQKLPDRKESAFRRARMKYTSKLRIELSESVSFFHKEFNESLEREMSSNDDVQELESIIPSYIGKQWENEANLLRDRVQSYSESISIELKDYINDDITSYIADGVSEDFANYVFGLTKTYMKKQPNGIEPVMQVKNFDFQMTADKSKWKKYGVVASGVALVMMSHPIVGIAVAVFGSKKIEKDSEKKFVATNKQALLDASYKMCIDYHNELDTWIEQIIKHIEKHLEECIAECYQSVINLMLEALQSKQQDSSNYEEELNRLKQVKDKIEKEVNYEC